MIGISAHGLGEISVRKILKIQRDTLIHPIIYNMNIKIFNFSDRNIKKMFNFLTKANH